MADLRSEVAERYAAAFFDLATEQDVVSKVEGDLAALKKALSESDDLRRLVRSPVFGSEQKSAAMIALLQRGGAHQLTQNLIALMARNSRLSLIGETITAFMRLAADARGEVSAEAISARPLTDDQTNALRSQIEAAVGKAVNLATAVDETLIGGMIVKVGSRMIDSSLRTKLNRLQQTLKEA